MIGLGLRLTLNGGRDAVVRLVVTALGVALGVAMLLIALAGINGVNAQNARYAWLESDAGGVTHQPAPPYGPGAQATPTDPVWWKLSADAYRGKIIGRVDVAVTGAHSPVPPGMTRLPGPGEIFASPAMRRLLSSVPSDQLAARYDGRVTATIGNAALPSPDALLLVVGHTPAQMVSIPGATQIARISTTTPSSCNGGCYFIGIDASGIDLVLSVASAALLFPVLIFIGTATRLSAARREQRFAAMRLVGATPRQIAVIAAVESTVAAVAGTVVGFGVFFALRAPLAGIPFTGAPFFTSDLSLLLWQALVVALGVPLVAAVAARIALRRVVISPLGVTRRVTPRPPRAWRLIPLVLGLGELLYFVQNGRPNTTPGQIEAFLTGILTVMVGLVLAGPWLTMVGARALSRYTNRPAGLIAGRRLADNPSAGFRSVSGLVLALFVTSVAIGCITTIQAYDGGGKVTSAQRTTLLDRFDNVPRDLNPQLSERALPAGVLDSIRSTPGVTAITLVHVNPTQYGPFPTGVVSCADITQTPLLGRCPQGAVTAEIWSGYEPATTNHGPPRLIAADLQAAQLATLPVLAIAVSAPHDPAAIEHVRSVLERTYPGRYLPLTFADELAFNDNVARTNAYQQLTDVVILASLPIAGCSLAVSVVAGLTDRKRPFSLLRLSGAPVAMLRRVVGLESAVPLLAISAFSIGIGFVAAYMFLRAQLGETLQAPNLTYCLIVVGGLVVSLAIIASTLPMLERVTGPESARND